MKQRLALAILGILVLGGAASAGDLEVSESVIDYGTVKEGPPVIKTVTLANRGSAPLTIAKAVASWACTSVTLGERDLEPGQSTELVIHYKTYKYPGKFDKSVSVFTGTDGAEETVIRLIGNVDPMPMGVIRMEPRKTEVGELAANRENEVQLVIQNDGDAPFTVSRVVSQNSEEEYFKADEGKGIEIAPGQNALIKFSVRPSEPGRYLERIVIYSDARNDIGKGYAGLLSGTVK